MVTGEDNWDDFKNGVTDTNKDLKWDDVANLARVTNNPNYLYETNVRNLGKAKWNVKFTTDLLKDVTLNGQYDTFLIKARSASNNVLFSYYYTVDSTSGTEVWVYDNEGQTDEFKYVFTREFGTGQNPEHRDGTLAGENKLISPALEDIGLAASYYNDPIYRNNLETVAKPDALRIDPNLNFAWHINPGQRPAEIINDGWWSGDWKGYINIVEQGTYRFRLESDDGSWLYIDGAMLINNGGDHSPRALEKDLELEKGYHSILVKYFESYGGEAVLKLEWKPPGKDIFAPISLDAFFVSAPKDQPAILKVSKKAPAAMSPGSEMTYTLYYQNFGGAYDSPAVLEDKLPTEVDFVSASDGKVPNAERFISWNIDSVAAFPQGLGSKTITVRINSDKVIAGTTVIENTATIKYGDQSFETKATTAVVKSNLPESVTVDNTRNNIGGETSVFWQDPITFNYYSSCAESVAINIYMNEGGSDISDIMAEIEDNKWSYTVPKFAPNHGSATVTYTITGAGCEKSSVNFNIYIDPAGFIYDTATGTRISGASVWL
ncbi:DUF11 domain-containing protein [Patescibacteria group bacterium]|nr:DUF11 domain-containing protein [Patescibacteria group bacterium]